MPQYLPYAMPLHALANSVLQASSSLSDSWHFAAASCAAAMIRCRLTSSLVCSASSAGSTLELAGFAGAFVAAVSAAMANAGIVESSTNANKILFMKNLLEYRIQARRASVAEMFACAARQLGNNAASVAASSDGTSSQSSFAEKAQALMGRLSCRAIHEARMAARPCASN